MKTNVNTWLRSNLIQVIQDRKGQIRLGLSFLFMIHPKRLSKIKMENNEKKIQKRLSLKMA